MHEINLQEIIDYSKCPMYYYFKYKCPDLKTEKINIIEKYDKDIHSVIYYALSKLQEGEEIETKDIKSSWGRIWIKDKRKSNIIFGESFSNKDTYNERRRKGLDSLLNFQNTFNNIPHATPIAINQEYKIQVSKNLVIKSNFELVRSSDKHLEVFTFKTDEHTNNRVVKEFDLKILANGIAAKELYKSDKILNTMYHVDKGTFNFDDANDINKEFFDYTVTNIYKAMYNKLYYMNSDNTCYTCIYKDICSNKTKVMQLLDKEAKTC
jgi:hypothetical protein